MLNDTTPDIAAQPLQILVAAKLYAPEEIAGPVAVVLEGATIRDIWRRTDAASARRRLAEQMPGSVVEVIDLGPWCLAPGFIDLHIHGYRGHDVTTGSQEDIEAIARELPRTGVTSFFPTIATVGRSETVEQVLRVVGAAENQVHTTAAEILGLRLEGPFISRAKKGAQFEPGIRPPDAAEMEELAAAGRGRVRIVDYAPEEDEEARFLATLVQLGILACIGHTDATYEQAIGAINGWARHSTHIFNAMSALDHVALVTDAVAPAGLPEGDYNFVGRKISVCCGAVRMTNGSLAGSILTLDQAVRNIMTFTGVGWSEAIGMATHVPARIAGVALRKGSIAPGADADLVALDNLGFVQRTWVRGLPAYQRAPDSDKETDADDAAILRNRMSEQIRRHAQ
ncbi:MAG: hypothetical protein E6J11_20950 [Chloroflexi bacterium]|nr:MAG: hypothetical protein E6J11_20950 [Chloroflexota bacterium]